MDQLVFTTTVTIVGIHQAAAIKSWKTGEKLKRGKKVRFDSQVYEQKNRITGRDRSFYELNNDI